MAKLKRYPKAPKAGASLKTLQKYEAACKKVKAHNDAIKREAMQRKQVRERVAKMKK
ncbi:hypothetical protein GCM10028806_19570 [Spirosoma terrae]|uniref:Uncharacterized protein n=1 Tax=Spirosoma terrae TaxID=1968276 RepID=A0A6L9L2H8_9BACT|nr:hypothetical protein [Spirosoma terrae]NDU94726.1 hypothetical protein [Spirosoma terrae]